MKRAGKENAKSSTNKRQKTNDDKKKAKAAADKKAEDATIKKKAATTVAHCQRHGFPADKDFLNQETKDALDKLKLPGTSTATGGTGGTGGALFPPTMYTHVEYTKGVCIPPSSKEDTKDDDGYDKQPYMNAYYALSPIDATSSTRLPSPLLQNPELWSHKYAATEAAKHGASMATLRLLGTITRTIVTKQGIPTIASRTKEERLCTLPRSSVSKRAKCTKAAAKKQALMALGDDDNDDLVAIEERTDEILAAWNESWCSQNLAPQWDPHYGHLLPCMVNDEHYVPLQALLSKGYKYKDGYGTAKEAVSPYPGLPSLPPVPIDTPTVLKHLATLQSPKGLYQIPLVLTYPRLIPIANTNKQQSYQLQIGIYAHRLLPEVLLERHLLQTVMAALDEGSYCLEEPLHMPPVPSTPKFASAEFPKLEYPSHDDDSESDDDGVIDLTLEGTTRESGDSLSAFTIPGLLKLWENTGTDTSEWPSLAPILQKELTMPLLLHQQDAVCWMRDMESLDGFGINSILWEERSWWDGGGSYYYSPALGQVRLDRPATMHGGILADEMGLGKTIMILALIVTTLDDLKKTAEENDSRHTTLIIVPPALLGQWRSEITKAAPQLQVQVYNAQTRKYDVDDDEVDICLATYPALEQTYRNGRDTASLQDCMWGRIVLDEMQEVRSPTTQIAKACCDRLRGNRRWMLSGTPLFDGIDDLRGELNFLSLEPYAAKSEDGFFSFSITNHWQEHSMHGLETLKVLGLMLLRRSKSMTLCDTGAPLMGLKPMTVEFVPISQTPAERALYCFLEYIVAHQFQTEGNEETVAAAKKSATDHRFCLRLLRELCLSPVLLSGGLGVTSELTKLNHLVVQYNRHTLRNLGNETAHLAEESQLHKRLSCTDAIRYLSQVQAKINTSEDFVSDLQLGAGGGMAKRNRATESVDEKIKECKEALDKATEQVNIARSMRAKANWHWALEKITTGAAPLKGVDSSIASLWRWRAAVLKQNENNANALPTLLMRGWRPSPHFTESDLHAAHPDFAWAHPVALVLQHIPEGVTGEDLHTVLAKTLGHRKFTLVFQANVTSRATLQLQHSDDAKHLVHASKKGIPVKTRTVPSVLEERYKEFEAAYRQAKSANDVFPTIDSRQRVKTTKRVLADSARGLLLVLEREETSPHIHLSRAKGPPRSMYPQKAQLIFNNLANTVEEANETLAVNVVTVQEQSKMLKNLERAADVPDEVKQMSAFESLESMQLHEYDKTFCCICMGILGSADPRCTDESKPGLVGLTPCGHLFCTKCIHDCIGSAHASHRQPQCPSCRKDIKRNDLVHIDPSLSSSLKKEDAKKRAKAKNVIERAATMLAESNGQLDPQMWLQLFLSIDLPDNVSPRGDPRISAIPKEVISFFRLATGFNQIHNKATELPNRTRGLSSKTLALVQDIPRNERSVVFTTSRAAIKHLMALFDFNSIAHREVFSSQNPAEAQSAVQEWKDSTISEREETEEEKKDTDLATEVDDNPLVLIVQAGAAASGLTLTAACKMFFLEPFVRQEEEQQAYARCHRYGQVNPVHAKVYFTPVSVESRLLEWRKQEASATRASDTKVVYIDFEEEEDANTSDTNLDNSEEEVIQEEDEEDVDQTRFLLGLE